MQTRYVVQINSSFMHQLIINACISYLYISVHATGVNSLGNESQIRNCEASSPLSCEKDWKNGYWTVRLSSIAHIRSLRWALELIPVVISQRCTEVSEFKGELWLARYTIPTRCNSPWSTRNWQDFVYQRISQETAQKPGNYQPYFEPRRWVVPMDDDESSYKLYYSHWRLWPLSHCQRRRWRSGRNRWWRQWRKKEENEEEQEEKKHAWLYLWSWFVKRIGWYQYSWRLM